MPHQSNSPHLSAVARDEQDLASTDELKIYKDEGEEYEQRASENLSEDKFGLVTETEQVSVIKLCVIKLFFNYFEQHYRLLIKPWRHSSTTTTTTTTTTTIYFQYELYVN